MISDEEETNGRLLLELNIGLCEYTLRRLQNINFQTTDLNDANFIMKAIEEHIKETTNPIV